MPIDRPGHGLSSFQPERTLLDWPQEVAALADHLGIERPLRPGVCEPDSGAAHRGGMVSTVGPYDRPGATAGMKRFNKIALAMARRVPWVVSRRLMAMMGRAFMKDPDGAAQRRFASSPAPDREAMSDPRAADMLLASMVESFRAGSDGAPWEARLLTHPWGFGPQDIAVQVVLRHGDADVNSPLATAAYLSRTIPDASLTVFPNEGHFFILKRWREVICRLTAAPGR